MSIEILPMVAQPVEREDLGTLHFILTIAAAIMLRAVFLLWFLRRLLELVPNRD